jgi:hypothetical protein
VDEPISSIWWISFLDCNNPRFLEDQSMLLLVPRVACLTGPFSLCSPAAPRPRPRWRGPLDEGLPSPRVKQRHLVTVYSRLNTLQRQQKTTRLVRPLQKVQNSKVQKSKVQKSTAGQNYSHRMQLRRAIKARTEWWKVGGEQGPEIVVREEGTERGGQLSGGKRGRGGDEGGSLEPQEELVFVGESVRPREGGAGEEGRKGRRRRSQAHTTEKDVAIMEQTSTKVLLGDGSEKEAGASPGEEADEGEPPNAGTRLVALKEHASAECAGRSSAKGQEPRRLGWTPGGAVQRRRRSGLHPQESRARTGNTQLARVRERKQAARQLAFPVGGSRPEATGGRPQGVVRVGSQHRSVATLRSGRGSTLRKKKGRHPGPAQVCDLTTSDEEVENKAAEKTEPGGGSICYPDSGGGVDLHEQVRGGPIAGDRS